MAVGHLLLKSFWENEAVFQMMMLAYNLFLLFKFDSLHISEYRQQIRTFRLKHIFLAEKIIRTARYVVMKLSEKYPYQDGYNNCLSQEIIDKFEAKLGQKCYTMDMDNISKILCQLAVNEGVFVLTWNSESNHS